MTSGTEKYYSSENLNRLTRFGRLIQRVEEAFFAILLLAITGLGLIPIVLRYFPHTGITWTEPLTRQLVLWIALFGAGAATVDRKHISVDVIGHLLPDRWKAVQSIFTGSIAAVTCAIMVWLSIKFVQDERQYASASTIFASVPEWTFELVLPLGFLLLTLRFIAIVLKDSLVLFYDLRKSG